MGHDSSFNPDQSLLIRIHEDSCYMNMFDLYMQPYWTVGQDANVSRVAAHGDEDLEPMLSTGEFVIDYNRGS